MTMLGKSTILASLSTLAAAPALAHGNHFPVADAAHGPLHLLLVLGGVFGAGVIAYLALRALRSRRPSDPTIQ